MAKLALCFMFIYFVQFWSNFIYNHFILINFTLIYPSPLQVILLNRRQSSWHWKWRGDERFLRLNRQGIKIVLTTTFWPFLSNFQKKPGMAAGLPVVRVSGKICSFCIAFYFRVIWDKNFGTIIYKNQFCLRALIDNNYTCHWFWLDAKLVIL